MSPSEPEPCAAIADRTPMSANLGLLALPLELLIRIFALLEGHQIVRCIAVCSYFKLAIENSITLQYVIKLDMFGYIDGPGRADSARLNQLERHIDTWNKLDWVESRIDLPISRALVEPREGIYAISNYTEVICIQLPSLHRGVPLRMWTLGFEFPVDLVEIDPSNNLLVALFTIPRSAINPSDTRYLALHLRTLSDNTPHPRATSPILFPTMNPVSYYSICKIRVMGLLLGLADVEGLEIWNWATCRKMTMLGSSLGNDPRPTFGSFEFLSTTSFLLPCDGRLEVYQIPVESPGVPPILIAAFCMPPTIPGYAGRCSVNSTPPVLHHRDDRDRLTSPSSLLPPPFRITEDSRCIEMVWIVFDVYRGIRLSLNIPFQIPLSALRHSALYPIPLAIPWDLWSKDIYFLKEGGPAASYRMSGGRLIDLTCSSDSHCTVSLFDLNRSRAGVPVRTRPDSSIDDDQSSHLIKSDVFPLGEISIKQPHPVYVASRSLSLGEYIPRFLILDDERIMIWARRDPEAPGMTAEEHRAHKLIVLSF